jgi:hypothetical protein
MVAINGESDLVVVMELMECGEPNLSLVGSENHCLPAC